jgi:clan AA aspartic protease
MGYVYCSIELINGSDFVCAKRHIIGEDEIRSTVVRMLVDSGSNLLAINENIQEYLQLPFQYRERAQLADGRWILSDVVGPVEVRFANRRATCNAYVMPGDSEPLLGAIPMEEMDVVVDMKRQELVINPLHPEGQSHRL